MDASPTEARPARATPSLTDRAAASLRRMILLNQLRPGEALNEAELVARLGVSRTPVREALKLLAGEGLVMLRRHRSALVTRLDRDGLMPLFELEVALESHAAGLAATRMEPAEIARLERLQAAMETARDDRDRYTRLNRQAHLGIVAGARSPAIAEAHGRLVGRLERARNFALDAGGRLDETLAEHRRILDALRAGAAEAARAEMARHVSRTQALVVDRLAEEARP